MRVLVISDIHANLAAFEAVLEDARGQWEFVWCLGDVVGYGPDPNECCELLRSLPHLCLAGNHDWAALARLEAIIHPVVYESVQQEISHIEAKADPKGPEPVVVIEAIKLLEAGMSISLCDQVWVVTATPEQQLRRLIEQRGMPEAEAHRRMTAQSPQAVKIQRADVVIDNSGTLEDTAAQVRAAWTNHIEPRRRGVGERA